jgi:hypothetical protein
MTVSRIALLEQQRANALKAIYLTGTTLVNQFFTSALIKKEFSFVVTDHKLKVHVRGWGLLLVRPA